MNPNRRLKRQMRDHNQTVCVSNATNSRSPDDLKSRIFIGNLNTSVITKRHLHLIFIQFGQIKAISMHKGYAFIQYDDQMDALNAVLAQDGQLIAGQAIDVNLVTEPKPHQKSSKTSPTSNESETSGEATETNSIENCESDMNSVSTFENSIDHMIVECNEVNERLDSLNHQNTNSSCSVSATSRENASIYELNSFNLSEGQIKRVKLDNDQQTNSTISNEESAQTTQISNNQKSDTTHDNSLNKQINNSNYNDNQSSSCLLSNPSNPSLSLLLTNERLSQETIPLALSQVQAYDILICGNCRTLFTSLPLFIEHKRSSKCRLRFVCHCHQK